MQSPLWYPCIINILSGPWGQEKLTSTNFKDRGESNSISTLLSLSHPMFFFQKQAFLKLQWINLWIILKNGITCWCLSIIPLSESMILYGFRSKTLTANFFGCFQYENNLGWCARSSYNTTIITIIIRSNTCTVLCSKSFPNINTVYFHNSSCEIGTIIILFYRGGKWNREIK